MPLTPPEPPGEALEWAQALIHGRQNITPRRLVAPGPSAAQLAALVEAAAAAPDHGELSPWRFVLIPEAKRPALGEVFRAALLERDAAATPQQQHDAGDKALRSPCLLLAVLDLSPRDTLQGQRVPAAERLVSLGCALQNMLLLARAMGFGSGLSSGQALASAALRSAFALAPQEQAVCFASFGTVSKARPLRQRPGVAALLSEFNGALPAAPAPMPAHPAE